MKSIKRIFFALVMGSCMTLTTQAQSVTQNNATGVVVDEMGEPLVGVSVTVEGSKGIGTSTDINGKFTLKGIPEGTKNLCFSFIGMKKVVSPWNGKAYHIVMQDDAKTMEDVVVTGYQVIDKRYNTSAVTSVNMDDIYMHGQTDLTKMLEGRIPDMVVTSNSGEVNSTARLRVRGTSTLIGNREPLWVLDGIILTDPVDLSPDVLNDPDYVNRIGNAISGINPQDIKRIDVLKDAAATALYGTRAANGVIVITTKSGREGRPIVSYSANLTARKRPYYTDSKINVMNSQERVQFSQDLLDQHYLYPNGMPLVGYEAALSNLYAGTYTQDQFNQAVSDMQTMNTDWFDILCKNSFSHDHSVSVSGGSDKVRFYTSIGYTGQDDVIRNTSNDRYTAMAKLDIELAKKLELEFNVNGYVNNRQYNAGDVNTIDYAYNTSRAIPCYNADGSLYYYGKSSTGSSAGYLNYNIVNEQQNSYTKQDVSSAMATINLRYKPLDYLNFNWIVSANTSSANIEEHYGESTYYAALLRRCNLGEVPGSDSEMPYGGQLSENDTRTKGYTTRLQGNLNKYFGEDDRHNINVAVGFEASSTGVKGNSTVNRGYYEDRGKAFISDIPSTFTTYSAWALTNVPTITDSRNNMLSAYATASYSLMDWFTINANGRYDGSNKFGSRSNEKLLPIWSVSGNLNLGTLFGIKAHQVDNLTLKASYGEQGNMLDGQTPVMVIKKGTMSSYYNEMTSKASYFANPDLEWEKTHSSNIGIESSFWKGRLLLGLEYYHKLTTDAFLSKTISDVNGYTEYVVNSGTITNQGFNFTLSATPIKVKDFYWILSGNVSKIYNKVKTAPGQDTYELSDFLNGTAVCEGYPIGTIWSYQFAGLSPSDGGPLFEDYEERQSELTGLNNYDTYTRVLTPTGKREPDVTGSINSTFTYKEWRLGVTLTYSKGASTRLFRLFDNFVSGYSAESNVSRDLLDRWQKPGDELITNIPSVMGSGNPNYYYYNSHYSSGYPYEGASLATDAWTMYDYSTARVVSADYLKVSNLQLTYEFNKKMLDRMHLGRLALTLSAQNLKTFCDSRLRGQTPTQGGFTEIQLSDTPTYTFGLNVEF